MYREEEYVLQTEVGQDTLCSCVIKLKNEMHAGRFIAVLFNVNITGERRNVQNLCNKLNPKHNRLNAAVRCIITYNILLTRL